MTCSSLVGIAYPVDQYFATNETCAVERFLVFCHKRGIDGIVRRGKNEIRPCRILFVPKHILDESPYTYQLRIELAAGEFPNRHRMHDRRRIAADDIDRTAFCGGERNNECADASAQDRHVPSSEYGRIAAITAFSKDDSTGIVFHRNPGVQAGGDDFCLQLKFLAAGVAAHGTVEVGRREDGGRRTEGY